MELELVRLNEVDGATLGVLLINDWPELCTLERGWENNVRRKSRIPEGVYDLQRIHSPKFGWTYEVAGVPGRTEIIFHAGNTQTDTAGCILLGKRWGRLDEKPAVLNSREGVKRFLKLMADRNHARLIIRS